MSAEETVNSYQDFIKSTADEYRYLSVNYLQNAAAAAAHDKTQTYFTIPLSEDDNFLFGGEHPDKYNITNFDDLNSLKNLEIKTEFKELYKEFMLNFFKGSDGEEQTSWTELNRYLEEQLQNGGMGISESIERQLVDRARDREISQNKLIDSNAYEQLASRGFDQPQPFLTEQLLVSKINSMSKVSELNRDLTTKFAELRINYMKDLVNQIQDIRVKSINETINYLQLYLKNNEIAQSYSVNSINSFKDYYNAVNQYYSLINNSKQILIDVKKFNSNSRYNYDKLRADVGIAQESQEIQAYTSIAQTAGTQAASALSGLNAVVSLAYSTAATV